MAGRSWGVPVVAVAALAAALAVVSPPAATALGCTGPDAAPRRIDLTIEGDETWARVSVPAATPAGIVVFGHGFGSQADDLDPLLARLATEARVVAIAPNFRGVSERDDTGFTRGFPLAAGSVDVVEVARRWLDACPAADTAVAAGFSMGGTISGRALTLHPRRADGRPLFDHWVAVSPMTDVVEEYLGAVALALVGTPVAINAATDLERELGGPFTAAPGRYLSESLATRTADLAASGVRSVELIHPVADGFVPIDQGLRLWLGLTLAGVPTALHTPAVNPPGSPNGPTIDSYLGPTLEGLLGQPYASPLVGHGAGAALDLAVSRITGLVDAAQ